MGKLINLNSLVPAAQIDPAMTTDAELASAVAIAGLVARTGSPGNINADTFITQSQTICIRWLDGNNTLINFPPNVGSGTMIQLDGLVQTSLEKKYMVQFFVVHSLPLCRIYYRSQNNGTWSDWTLA